MLDLGIRKAWFSMFEEKLLFPSVFTSSNFRFLLGPKEKIYYQLLKSSTLGVRKASYAILTRSFLRFKRVTWKRFSKRKRGDTHDEQVLEIGLKIVSLSRRNSYTKEPWGLLVKVRNLREIARCNGLFYDNSGDRICQFIF